MSKLKINDLDLYQTEDIDTHKVQGGFIPSFFDISTLSTYPFLLPEDLPSDLPPDLKKIYESELIPGEFQLAVSNQEGNAFGSITIGKTESTNFATSLSMVSL